MCGIAGMLACRPDPDALRRIPAAATALRHRGPDGGGFLRFEDGRALISPEWPAEAGAPQAVFVHRRLSILDLSDASAQPMLSADGRFALTFNGEIYNYVELKRELEQLGHEFRSTGDTEVLLAAYAQWGNAAFGRFTGMFAFALLDLQRRRVVLCRDQFGIKPLYYTRSRGELFFASELHALLTLAPQECGVDIEPLYRYLRYGITDEGDCTLFAHIRQLPAGHFAEIDLDGDLAVAPQPYWQPSATPQRITFADATTELRRLFLESVRLHLRSDVPVGSALSGGIDSSAIVAAMRAAEPDLEINTFSYIASGSEFDEERWVDLAAQSVGARSHKIYPEPEAMAQELRDLSAAQGEPFRSTSIYAQYRVFREARAAGVKVLLDGQGADELLGGYRSYLGIRLASLIREGRLVKAAAFLKRASAQPGASASYMLQKAAEYLLPHEVQGPLRKLARKELMPPWLNEGWFRNGGVAGSAVARERGSSIFKDELLREVRRTSLPSLLRYEDRNSMAYSLESRVPFLTPKIADFVLSLPDEYIIGEDGTTKRVFREAMRGLVPDAILDRRDKIGFATPEEQWLRRLDGWVRALLESDAAQAIPALDLAQTKGLWDDTLAGRRGFDAAIWRALNVIHWTQQFDVRYA